MPDYLLNHTHPIHLQVDDNLIGWELVFLFQIVNTSVKTSGRIWLEAFLLTATKEFGGILGI